MEHRRSLVVKLLKLAVLSLLVILSGCAVTKDQKNNWVYPPMALPLQASVQQEVQIARLNQLLQRTDLPDEVKAKMYYERGSYYDAAGLRHLARLDFNQSLSLNPVQPIIFNMLGVYFTQVGQFDMAYEAFDSSLELDSKNQYAERNRAIALYYGGRFDLALEEMQAHYADEPSDPFRALWLYIIEKEKSPELSLANLKQRYEGRNNEWGWVLVAIMLDEITEEEAFKAAYNSSKSNVELAQRLTETYFYLAKHYQYKGMQTDSLLLYQLALAFNVYEYVEHRYSLLERERILSDQRQKKRMEKE